MTSHDDDAMDELMRLVGAELEQLDVDVRYRDEPMLAWLAHDLRAGMSAAERERDERDAAAFARSVRARRKVQRAEQALPRSIIRRRDATFVGQVGEAMEMASDRGCAVLLDLSAAAGAGRDLWDEPVDTWVELPPELPNGRYLALGVTGDSMEPVLRSRDVIVVHLDAAPAIDDIVVAHLGDQGYVVKRVASMRGGHLELASFNPAYASLHVRRERSTILGKVVARLSRE